MEKSCKLKNTYQKRSVNPKYNTIVIRILTFNLETPIKEHSTNSQNSQNIKLQANSFIMNCQSRKEKEKERKTLKSWRKVAKRSVLITIVIHNSNFPFNLETRIKEHSKNSQNSQNIMKITANSFNMNCQSKKRKREREKNIIRNQNGNERKSGDETNFRAIFIYRKPPLAILYTQSRS